MQRKDCMLGCYLFCPGPETLKQCLKEWCEKDTIEEITYQQWISMDKCEIEKIIKPVDDFINVFSSSLLNLKKHAYIAKSQASFLKAIKHNLLGNEVVVLLDFAENYSYAIQDEVQSFNWNNSQCSLHPVIIYFLNSTKKMFFA